MQFNNLRIFKNYVELMMIIGYNNSEVNKGCVLSNEIRDLIQ